jgi:hypothetical protein
VLDVSRSHEREATAAIFFVRSIGSNITAVFLLMKNTTELKSSEKLLIGKGTHEAVYFHSDNTDSYLNALLNAANHLSPQNMLSKTISPQRGRFIIVDDVVSYAFATSGYYSEIFARRKYKRYWFKFTKFLERRYKTSTAANLILQVKEDL